MHFGAAQFLLRETSPVAIFTSGGPARINLACFLTMTT